MFDDIPDLTLDFLMTDDTPSQAWGSYVGYKFFFYARYNYWSFAISRDPQVSPEWLLDVDDTAPEARARFFSEPILHAYEAAFVRTCYAYGPEEFSASYMPAPEVERIIRECLAQFDRSIDAESATSDMRIIAAPTCQ